MTIITTAVQTATALNLTNVDTAKVERTATFLNSLIETMQANPFGAGCFVLICAAFAYWKKGS
jgi:hypothetical protein